MFRRRLQKAIFRSHDAFIRATRSAYVLLRAPNVRVVHSERVDASDRGVYRSHAALLTTSESIVCTEASTVIGNNNLIIGVISCVHGVGNTVIGCANVVDEGNALIEFGGTSHILEVVYDDDDERRPLVATSSLPIPPRWSVSSSSSSSS